VYFCYKVIGWNAFFVPAQKVLSFRISTRARARRITWTDSRSHHVTGNSRSGLMKFVYTTLHAKQKLIPRETRHVVRIRTATSTACHALLAVIEDESCEATKLLALKKQRLGPVFGNASRLRHLSRFETFACAPFRPLRVALDRQRTPQRFTSDLSPPEASPCFVSNQEAQTPRGWRLREWRSTSRSCSAAPTSACRWCPIRTRCCGSTRCSLA